MTEPTPHAELVAVLNHGDGHRCKLPNRWRRWRMGLKHRALVTCSCGRRYRLWTHDGQDWIREMGA